MQKNDFEKNVQHRMDELQLYPSAEVWPEVERRIRKEKKRRWFIFWFLFPALLAGGGATIYFLTTTNKKNISSSQVQKQIEKPLVEKNKENALVDDQRVTIIPAKDSVVSADKILTILRRNKDAKQPSATTSRTYPVKNGEPVISFESGNGAKKRINPSDTFKGNSSDIIGSVKLAPADTIIVTEVPVFEIVEIVNRADSLPQVIADANKRSLEQINETKPQDDSVQADQPKPIVSVADSIEESNKPSQLGEKKKNKWNFGVTLNTGFSNRARELSFGGQKNYSSAASLVIGGGAAQLASYNGNGNSKPGLFWETGAYIQSNSKKKTNVSFGLSVSSFTHRQQTGIFRDSSINADASGYYSYGNSLLYSNRYYYLQIPVMVHWQLNKGNKLPLVWQNGLSPSFLLASNALLYNYSRNIFYRDKTSLNKVQLAFRSGLYGRFGAASKRPVSAGLFLNYNFSGLQKTYQYDKNHLLSFGIQLMMPLKKN